MRQIRSMAASAISSNLCVAVSSAVASRLNGLVAMSSGGPQFQVRDIPLQAGQWRCGVRQPSTGSSMAVRPSAMSLPV